jgi:hypothetical protein
MHILLLSYLSNVSAAAAAAAAAAALVESAAHHAHCHGLVFFKHAPCLFTSLYLSPLPF